MQSIGKLKVFGLKSDIPRFPAGAGDHFLPVCLWFPSPLFKGCSGFYLIHDPAAWRLDRLAYRRYRRLKSDVPKNAICHTRARAWTMVTACNDDIQQHPLQAHQHLL